MTGIDSIASLIGTTTGEITWWQMSLRAVIVFLFGLLFIRVFGRRAFGKQTPLDIVLAIVIGSNLSRAMTGNAPLLPTLAATALLAMLYWLTIRFAARLHRFGVALKGRPVRLVHRGEPDEAEMQQRGVSAGDLAEAARQSGLAREDVREAYLERNGEISVIGPHGKRGGTSNTHCSETAA